MSQYTSYYLYQKYVSYDNGSTWTPVYPEEYSISGDSSDPQAITKKQDNDPECGYTPPVIPQYRWVEDGDNYICDDCGYTPTPQYRTISGVPYCTGYDKMVDTQYQVSYDSGSTWSTVSSSTLTVEHDSVDCGYAPPTDYSTQYLTFRALEDGCKWKFSNSGMSYSLDSGSTWNTLTASANTPTVQSGSTIMWKATLSASDSNGIGTFSSSGQFEVEGNIMSLKYGDNFSGQTTLPDSYSFARLFSSNYSLRNAENLVLPATTLTERCYANMFDACQWLWSAPELPATTLAESCYSTMFHSTHILTAPALPATTLANKCYKSMFWDCSSLTTAPALPATTLSQECYMHMFQECTSLTTAPVLSATTLANGCYAYMFSKCSSLTSATDLPATTLAISCYASMFLGCTSLTTAPALPATTLASWCYHQMFKDCSSIGAITCLATDISADNCTQNWLSGVASSGTFYKNPSMSNWATGVSGIPIHWTVQDYQG